MKSEAARKIPNFSGGFSTVRVTLSTDREKGTIVRFVVFSSGKRHSLFKYLWHKLVWDELSKLEFELFLSMPESLSNPKIVGFLRSRLSIDKRVLRKRLNMLELLLGEKVTSLESYRGLKRMRLDIQKEIGRLPKVPKFSGYCRSISAIGKSQGCSVKPEPASDFEFVCEEEFDWFFHLSVGEITLLSQAYSLPEDEPNKDRNGKFINLIKTK